MLCGYGNDWRVEPIDCRNIRKCSMWHVTCPYRGVGLILFMTGDDVWWVWSVCVGTTMCRISHHLVVTPPLRHAHVIMHISLCTVRLAWAQSAIFRPCHVAVPTSAWPKLHVTPSHVCELIFMKRRTDQTCFFCLWLQCTDLLPINLTAVSLRSCVKTACDRALRALRCN